MAPSSLARAEPPGYVDMNRKSFLRLMMGLRVWLVRDLDLAAPALAAHKLLPDFMDARFKGQVIQHRKTDRALHHGATALRTGEAKFHAVTQSFAQRQTSPRQSFHAWNIP